MKNLLAENELEGISKLSNDLEELQRIASKILDDGLDKKSLFNLITNREKLLIALSEFHCSMSYLISIEVIDPIKLKDLCDTKLIQMLNELTIKPPTLIKKPEEIRKTFKVV